MLSIGPLHDLIYSYHGNTSSMIPFVLVRNRSSVYLFPDNETFSSLLGSSNISGIPPLPTTLTAMSNLLDDNLTQYVPSWKTTFWSNADEMLFALITKISFLNPVDVYLDEEPHIVPGLTNAGIVRVPLYSNTSYFASWLGKGIWKWYDVKTVTGLRFGSIDRANYSVMGSPVWRMTDGWNNKVYNQQEARLLLLPDGLSVFVICTARFHNGPFQQMYGIMELNETSMEWELGLENTVVWVEYQRHNHMKNLVPFLYNDTVHLIPSFFPLIILQTLPPTSPPRSGPVIVLYNEFADIPNNNDTTNTTINTTYSLPWDPEYGVDIRGGTPAFPVPPVPGQGGDPGQEGYYLLFFHTRVHGSFSGVDHYLMGAMTLCPTPPFLIRSMSSVPIVLNPSW